MGYGNFTAWFHGVKNFFKEFCDDQRPGVLWSQKGLCLLYNRSMNPPSSDAAAEPKPRSFTAGASEHVRAVQAALVDLLAGAGLAGARPTTVGRTLGLDKTLAWKIVRFMEDEDLAGAARHMPGSGGVEIVLKAARKRGATNDQIEAVREADRVLRAFVEQHAGDRRSFETMLASGGRDERIEAEERRAYYRAGSAVWGVRARVQFLMLALRPSEKTDGMLDAVQISGLIDFERLRPDVPWIIRRLRAASDTGKGLSFEREPLDPEGKTGPTVPLLPSYCSQPLPQLEQFTGSNGWVYDQIAPGPVGRRGALTCITGEIYRSALPYRRSEDNAEARYALTVRTPVEGVLFDLLLHRSLSHFQPKHTRVRGLLEDRPSTGASAADSGELTAPGRSQPLGSPPVLQTPRIPGYAQMIAEGLGLANWGSMEGFRAYRSEIAYPVAPCEIMKHFEIGETAGLD